MSVPQGTQVPALGNNPNQAGYGSNPYPSQGGSSPTPVTPTTVVNGVPTVTTPTNTPGYAEGGQGMSAAQAAALNGGPPAPATPTYGRTGATPAPDPAAVSSSGTGSVPGLTGTENQNYNAATSTLANPVDTSSLTQETSDLSTLRTQMLSEVGSIIDNENNQVSNARNSANAQAAAAGLLGTSQGMEKVDTATRTATTQAQTDALAAQKSLADILTSIDKQAVSDSVLMDQQTRAAATGDITTLNAVATQRTANQTAAQATFAAASKTPNVDFNAFINSPYGQTLLQQTGYDSTSAALVWNANQNIADQIQWVQTATYDANGNPVWSGVDPKTGQHVSQSFDTKPPTGSSQVNLQGLPFYQQDNPDGTPNPKGLLIPAPLTTSEKTAALQQYQFYVAQTENAGGTPVDEFTYAAALKAVVANTNANGVTPTSPNPVTSTDPSVGGSAFASVVADPTSSASKNNLIGWEDPATGKFLQYPDLQSGINAGLGQVSDRLSKLIAANPDATILDLSKSIKGTGNNDPIAWANSVASNLGVSSSTKLSTLDPTQTFYAMAKHESSYDPLTSFNPMDESRPPAGTAGNAVLPSIGRTANQLWNDTLKYTVMGGTLQQYTGGMSSTKVDDRNYKKAIDAKSAALVTAAGVDPAILQTQYAANAQAIDQQVSYMASVKPALDGAEQTGQQIVNGFQGSGINPADGTWANQVINTVTKGASGGPIFAWQSGMAELANEYSQVFSRGGQNTVQAHYNAQDILNGNIKFSDLQGVLDELQSVGKIVVDTRTANIQNISGGAGTDAVTNFYKYIYGGNTTSDTTGSNNASANVQTMSDGTKWVQNADGSYTQQ